MYVRIRATGQTIDMQPRVAVAMINGGTAEAFTPAPAREVGMLARALSTAAQFIIAGFRAPGENNVR